jgi:septum formation protein
LASASPRRRFFLEHSGFQFKVWTPQVDESVIPGELPLHYASRIAELKYKAAKSKFASTPDIIVSADTIVSLGNKIFGKPENRGQAEVTLKTLSGNWHQVTTVICCGRENKMVSGVEISKVHFTRIDDEYLTIYLDSMEWQGKAGGYAIQGLASFFVDEIKGTMDNVIGFPFKTFIELLHELEVFKSSQR